MWELDYKEGLSPKNWCFQIAVLEKILESPLDFKEMRQSILTEINSEYFLEVLMLKLQYFGHLMQRADLLEKTWCRERLKAKWEAEEEMDRQHHWLNGHESEQILGDSGGQGSLECCSPWGRKELDMT